MEQVGEFSERVIDVLGLSVKAGTPIYISKSNVDHMEEAHPGDFKRYFKSLRKILRSPNYVGLRECDGSIEYVKVMSENVEVVVRVSNDGQYYTRSLFVIHPKRVKRLCEIGELKSLTNE